MDVPAAFSAGELRQEQWPSALLPAACSQYCHPACESTWPRSLDRSFVHPIPAGCVFVHQERGWELPNCSTEGGPCVGDWMFMIPLLWERTFPILRDLQAVLMLPATSTTSKKEISVRKVIMELFNPSPYMYIISKKPIRLCCLLA